MEIALPFTFGAGYVNVVDDPYVEAAQHITTSVCTRLGERIMRPDYGTSVYDTLLGPAGAPRDDQIEVEVRTVLTRYHPEIDVVSVDAVADENLLRIHIRFALPDIGEDDSLAIAEVPLT